MSPQTLAINVALIGALVLGMIVGVVIGSAIAKRINIGDQAERYLKEQTAR